MHCTCEFPSAYNDPEHPEYDRHEVGCELAPDTAGWLFYPHDGELKEGGVFVNPRDTSRVYLLVEGYLCPAPLEPSLNEDED